MLSVLMYPCYLSVLTRANPCSPCSPCSSVGSVGKFSNNKIGGVVSVLLLCFMTAKYVLQGTVRFVGIVLPAPVPVPGPVLRSKTVHMSASSTGYYIGLHSKKYG